MHHAAATPSQGWLRTQLYLATSSLLVLIFGACITYAYDAPWYSIFMQGWLRSDAANDRFDCHGGALAIRVGLRGSLTTMMTIMISNLICLYLSSAGPDAGSFKKFPIHSLHCLQAAVSTVKYQEYADNLATASDSANLLESALRVGASIREMVFVNSDMSPSGPGDLPALHGELVSQTARFDTLLELLQADAADRGLESAFACNAVCQWQLSAFSVPAHSAELATAAAPGPFPRCLGVILMTKRATQSLPLRVIALFLAFVLPRSPSLHRDFARPLQASTRLLP